MNELKEKESRVERLIQEGYTEEAVQDLYGLILDCAEQRDFARAEALRDRLYQVNPMAIKEIAQSGEIIEQKKSESLDREHMELWSDLYSGLSEEEANTLYYTLSTDRFDPDVSVIREGDADDRLYFVEKGQLRLSFHKEGRVMHLTTVGPGEILGEETFFARTSRHTYSATATTSVDVSVLPSSVLDEWEQEAKNLKSVLYDFSCRRNRIPELLEELRLDRREHERVQVKGTMAVRILNEEGKPVSRPFKGEIWNVSSGGLAFANYFKKEDTAQALLGKPIAIMCKLSALGEWKDLKKLGRVVGIQSHPFSEYSFHVRFDQPISQKFVDSLDPADSSGTSPDLEVEV